MQKKGKRIIKYIIFSFIGLLSLTILVLGIILHGRIESMMSIKYKGDGLYTMNYKQNYHLDRALKKGIRDEDDLLEFICDEMFFGYKIETNISQYGCSAFATKTPDGNNTVGRNFDLKGTDTLSIYTHPKKGYASISTVSLDMLGVGGDNSVSPKSFKGRIALLASPYICVDGMNEKGLSAALLDMSYPETHEDTDKPDLLITLAVRLLLDKTSTVDEAIELLGKYDIQTAHGWTQHIFISDKSGKSVVVEWYDGNMNVVDYHVCTNFWMSDPSLNNDYSNQCYRFNTIDNVLKYNEEVVSIDDSFSILKAVRQYNTVWSVVFNLDDFSAYYAIASNYTNIHHLTKKDY